MIRWTIGKFTRRLLALDDSPERIALAFAIGVFLSFSPLLGLHTFLGLVFAFLFGLNRAAILVGIFVNNPWTLVPIYALANWVGGLVIGFPSTQGFPALGWDVLWHSRFWVELARGWRLLIPLVVGSFMLAVIAGTGSFFLALYVVRQAKARRAHGPGQPGDLSVA